MAKKDKADKKIKEIESLVDKIEKEKHIYEGDAENLKKLLIEYGSATFDAIEQTKVDAEEAKKSNGQKGSIKSLVEFEEMAKKHEKKAKTINAKTKNIEAQIKEGEIELDKSLLESMTPDERKEYMEFMTPSGREKIKKKHPKLLSYTSLKVEKKLVNMENMGESVSAFCKSFPERINNFLVSPAEAAIVAGQTAACSTVAGCPAATVIAVVAIAAAYKEYIDCLETSCSCKWYKPWCCSTITWCLVTYTAALA